MKIKPIILKKDEAKVICSELDVSLINGIRRTMLDEVPKLAVEDVIFYGNTSPIFNEVIASRLGLLPIPTDNNFVRREECSCDNKGCAKCTVMYTLSKEGPCTVYSRDLEPADKDHYIMDLDIPIVKLDEGQRIVLEAVAQLGTGREHAKWQAACAVGYKYYPKIVINKCNLCGKCIESCPKKILKVDKDRICVENVEECILCRECEDVCEFKSIKVSEEKDKFIFRWETDGSLAAEEVFQKAVDILNSKYEEFEEKLGL